MTQVRLLLQRAKQMTEDIQKWIRDNFELIEKIRNRFEKYFQLQQSLRNSNRSSEDEDVSSKIQNQWRKLNDLLNKQIPQKIPKVDLQTSKNLQLLRLQALRIQNMFKNKFGQEKHNEFKLIETTESWKNPVFISHLKISENQSAQVRYEEIPDQNESKVKSSIIDLAPGEEQKEMIKSLEEGERRSSSRILKVQAEQKRIKICGLILICTLLLVLLMSFINIPLKSKLFVYLFQNDL